MQPLAKVPKTDSKSAYPCGHGSSTPPPGTMPKPHPNQLLTKLVNRFCLNCAQSVPNFPLTGTEQFSGRRLFEQVSACAGAHRGEHSGVIIDEVSTRNWSSGSRCFSVLMPSMPDIPGRPMSTKAISEESGEGTVWRSPYWGKRRRPPGRQSR